MIYVASVFKTCKAAVRVSPAGKTSQDFPSSALFSCHEVWFAHVRSVVNNISKSALHKIGLHNCNTFRNKTFATNSDKLNSNKFIHIVIRRHNTTIGAMAFAITASHFVLARANLGSKYFETSFEVQSELLKLCPWIAVCYANVASFAANFKDWSELAGLKKFVTRDDDAAASIEDLCFWVCECLSISDRPRWLIENSHTMIAAHIIFIINGFF